MIIGHIISHIPFTNSVSSLQKYTIKETNVAPIVNDKQMAPVIFREEFSFEPTLYKLLELDKED